MTQIYSFTDYQAFTATTLLPTANTFRYLGPGLVAEAGEVLGVFAKAVRDEYSDDTLRSKLEPELGDVLYFLAQISKKVGMTFSLLDVSKPLNITAVRAAHYLTDDCLRVMDLVEDESIIGTDYIWYQLRKYIGRCLGLILVICDGKGISIQDIIQLNVAKLNSRKERGVIGGSGDKR